MQRSPFIATILSATAVFLAATLSFGMEPLVGRMLLPAFGGVPQVWLTTLMVFQGTLLAAYAYGHLLAPRLGYWHLLVLVGAAMLLPLSVPVTTGPPHPSVLIRLLILHVAVPFFALSTTAIVLQLWLSRSWLGKSSEPYPLYSVSNLGSLLALLGYPFVIEPLFGLTVQRTAWSYGYGAFVVLVMLTWLVLSPDLGPARAVSLRSPAPTWRTLSSWASLSGIPAAHLGAVTHVLSQEMGSFPMIWVLPLAGYLASFAVVFRRGGGAPGILKRNWPELVLIGGILSLPMLAPFIVALHLLVFFALCVLSHGLLYELRPPAERLTGFYLVMAAAGWLGGISVSIVAPLIFPALWEYPLLIFLFFTLFWTQCRKPVVDSFWCGPSVLRIPRTLLIVGLVTCWAGAGLWSLTLPDARYRTLYGTYSIFRPTKTLTVLTNGGTLHGAQDRSSPREPHLYYGRDGGVYGAIDVLPSPRRLAIVGLGAGVTATYGRPGDSIVFVEIDGDLEAIARTHFTFLADTEAEVNVVTGDARLVLPTLNEPAFDAILLDAFTGDAVPVHLLTREAIAGFLSRLTEDGLLVLHLSSRYYNMVPTVKATIGSLGLVGAVTRSEDDEVSPAIVVVAARSREVLTALPEREWKRFHDGDGIPAKHAWTDDYINVIDPWLGSR